MLCLTADYIFHTKTFDEIKICIAYPKMNFSQISSDLVLKISTQSVHPRSILSKYLDDLKAYST